MTDLAGKHAFITGGGSGIGLATARALAARGAKLTLAARNLERLEKAATALGALAVACDVREEAAVSSACAAARTKNGPIDILVNNAGVALSAPFKGTELTFWRQVLDTNLTGAFLCTRAALPDMLAARWGRVVNVASVCALKGYAYLSAYCASKHGLLGFTRALAHETAARGVTVNAVCPGYVETDVITEATRNIAQKTHLSEAEARASLVQFNPTGRLITPEEVASSIDWICSAGAASVNGAALPMTGGEI
ncbi:MAG: SDR family oxidoreductase [Hyphomonadaceae bacterium]|nr:SDR family oxidoreductase [Hyphomonadaceae bacterium]